MPTPILERVLNRQEKFKTPIIVTIHHVLMDRYGWIPLEEFKKLPADVVFNLLDACSQQNEMERKTMKKGRR